MWGLRPHPPPDRAGPAPPLDACGHRGPSGHRIAVHPGEGARDEARSPHVRRTSTRYARLPTRPPGLFLDVGGCAAPPHPPGPAPPLDARGHRVRLEAPDRGASTCIRARAPGTRPGALTCVGRARAARGSPPTRPGLFLGVGAAPPHPAGSAPTRAAARRMRAPRAPAAPDRPRIHDATGPARASRALGAPDRRALTRADQGRYESRTPRAGEPRKRRGRKGLGDYRAGAGWGA